MKPADKLKTTTSSSFSSSFQKQIVEPDSMNSPYNDLMGKYENYRSYLLQYQFLNASLKDSI